MKQYYKIIKKSKLFMGINENDLDSMLKCLNVTIKQYKKNEYIFRLGNIISSVGLVVDGNVHIIKEDFWGNRTILSEICEGQLFGETYACSLNTTLSVNAVSTQKTDVLFFDVNRIIKTCPSACTFHSLLIQNLITVLADKNIMLTSKIEHMAQRTTREKLLSYLSEQSQKTGSSSFDIPFNRQQLADFLSVDRSAMSNELCKLRDAGILIFEKQHFELL